MSHDVIDSAEAILAEIDKPGPPWSDRAAEVEAARRMPPDLVQELSSAGVFGLLLPRSHGGVEGTLADELHAVESLARPMRRSDGR